MFEGGGVRELAQVLAGAGRHGERLAPRVLLSPLKNHNVDCSLPEIGSPDTGE